MCLRPSRYMIEAAYDKMFSTIGVRIWDIQAGLYEVLYARTPSLSPSTYSGLLQTAPHPTPPPPHPTPILHLSFVSCSVVCVTFQYTRNVTNIILLTFCSTVIMPEDQPRCVCFCVLVPGQFQPTSYLMLHSPLL